MTQIGHNNPPEPTPYEASVSVVDDLYQEAKHWLDGAPIDTQEMADAVGKLIRQCQGAVKVVEQNRVLEKRPFDQAAAEVQERYKPLIVKLDKAISTAKQALVPFMQAQMAEQARKAEEARLAAEAARKAAEAAAFVATDLESVERREAAIAHAKAAETTARKAEGTKVQVSTGARAIGIRTVWKAEITDTVAFARHLWATNAESFMGLLQAEADRRITAGRPPTPGVRFIEEKVPV